MKRSARFSACVVATAEPLRGDAAMLLVGSGYVGLQNGIPGNVLLAFAADVAAPRGRGQQ